MSNNPMYFKYARGLSLLLAVILIGSSLIHSREAIFLLLNKNLGPLADHFFKTLTLFAEGWIWIPYFLIAFGWLKKDARFILINFILSTLFTQIPKKIFFDAISRPIASGIDPTQMHTVTGVEMHSWNSFPSGHTATAFSLFILSTYLFPHKIVFFVGLAFALLSGYARVYLGQHFPIDIGGGILVAILSIQLSIFINHKMNANNRL